VPLDIILGRDLATQLGGGEIGPGWRKAGIEVGHVNNYPAGGQTRASLSRRAHASIKS
jgi:hypothetical protein